MPQQLGSVTFSAADVATAASAEHKHINLHGIHQSGFKHIPAFPPFRKISNPASVARGWEDETTPLVPYTCERRLGKRCSTSSGWLIFDQSIPFDLTGSAGSKAADFTDFVLLKTFEIKVDILDVGLFERC